MGINVTLLISLEGVNSLCPSDAAYNSVKIDKPLPEKMLTKYRWGLVAFTEGHFTENVQYTCIYPWYEFENH